MRLHKKFDPIVGLNFIFTQLFTTQWNQASYCNYFSQVYCCEIRPFSPQGLIFFSSLQIFVLVKPLRASNKSINYSVYDRIAIFLQFSKDCILVKWLLYRFGCLASYSPYDFTKNEFHISTNFLA